MSEIYDKILKGEISSGDAANIVEDLQAKIEELTKELDNEINASASICEQVSKVYCDITSGRIAKANTLADDVIAVHEDVCQEIHTEELKHHMERAKQAESELAVLKEDLLREEQKVFNSAKELRDLENLRLANISHFINERNAALKELAELKKLNTEGNHAFERIRGLETELAILIEAIEFCLKTYKIMDEDGYHIKNTIIGLDGIKALVEALAALKSKESHT
jgi:uncharacterized membrane-anchored protein YhcB (DUF1043 family)